MKFRLGLYLRSPLGVWYRICDMLSAPLNKKTAAPALVHQHTRNYDKERAANYWEATPGRVARTVIYTCITNKYDDLREIATPGYINSDCDYICYTDDDGLVSQGTIGVWQIRQLAFNELDDTRNNRWHKMHPHILFPEYEASIYMDANVDVLSDRLFSEATERGQSLLLPQHPSRDCIYEEYKKILSQFMDDPQRVTQELGLIRRSKMPTHYGLGENNILFRRHHDKTIQDIMDEWWDMEVKYSKRDQLSLVWLLWKHGIDIKTITFKNPRFDTENYCVFRHQ